MITEQPTRWLGLLGVDRLDDLALLPWLLLAALLPLLALRLSRPAAIPWPAFDEARVAGAGARELARPAAAVLRVAALIALAVVLARPLVTRDLPPASGLGLDLMLVVDTSASMAALDARAGVGSFEPRTRLDLAREAVARFAARRVNEGDRVGLVVFGDTAFTQCPLTHDGSLLEAALERVVVKVAGNSTALGDALALAVKRVSGEGRADRRVIVLLTDGRSNAGAIPVSVATELAVAADVRVHTVAIGVGGGAVAVESDSTVRYERHDPDPATLRRIAAATRGRFFEARNSADLLLVYDAIDRLERAPRPLPRRSLQSEAPGALLMLAIGLLLGEIVVTRGVARPVP